MARALFVVLGPPLFIVMAWLVRASEHASEGTGSDTFSLSAPRDPTP
jgi:hypothetical protein